MCNKLHENHELCPEEGIAWKIFFGNRSLIDIDEYIKSEDGWIKWINEKGDGFCMFATISEAIKALGDWDKIFPNGPNNIKKVKYKKGLGICIEEGPICGEKYKILIAKEFKIIKNTST